MSKLFAFLNPEPIHEEKEVVVSNRFKDENGEVVPFRIRAISQRENDEITRKSFRRVSNVNGQIVKEFDNIEYQLNVVLRGTVYPSFADKELCDAYNTPNPLDVIENMLTAGEFAKLADAISKISGFEDNSLAEEAKN